MTLSQSLYVCGDPATVKYRQTVLYDIAIEYLHVVGVSWMALTDECLLGNIFDDDTVINILHIIYDMYLVRLTILKDNG